MPPAIEIQSLSKKYHLGVTHAGSIREAANRTAAKLFKRSSKTSVQEALPDPTDTQSSGKIFWALRDISLQINTGEVVGIIGKNGAGKSTLLKILSRITYPTEGRATLQGRVASLLEVGTGFHPELTGRENIYMNGTILGMTRREIDGQLDAIMEFAGIGDHMDTPVKRYSSGMIVRLGFAIAAHLDPEILIVDEVLAVGDVEFQKRCLGKMQSVAESGKTVLFVSHNLASIQALTTRTVVLSKGKILYDGPTEEGIARYLDENLESARVGIPASQLPRPFKGLNRAVEIEDLQIQAIEPDTPPGISDGADFRLSVTVKETAQHDSFLIGMSVHGDDDVAIGFSFSPAQEPLRAGETKELHYHLHLPLAPGSYHCSLSVSDVRSASRFLHDSLQNVLPFTIPQPSMEGLSWSRNWGRTCFSTMTPLPPNDPR